MNFAIFLFLSISQVTSDQKREIPIPPKAEIDCHEHVTYHLTEEQIKPLYEEAVNRWVRAGIKRERFKNVKIKIVNFNGENVIAYGGYNYMKIDYDCGGGGWFIDPTPAKDEEYYLAKDGRQYAHKGTGGRGHYDLLSAVAHELGHHLGFVHNNGTRIMEPYVPKHQRILKPRPK
tara:strand:- start:1552 stop:2076 length:525 start_codon:yes stop_codon:yes gene_type:complete